VLDLVEDDRPIAEVAQALGISDQAIKVMAAEDIPVEIACRVLDVSTSGYYACRSRPPSVRAIRHAWLTDLIEGAPGLLTGPQVWVHRMWSLVVDLVM
jgi:hypothetical protein